MASIPIPFIGGGGDGSDDCTATASDVLEGKTAIYDGSDDEPANGSMKDYSGTTSRGSSSLDEDNSRLLLAVPNTGKYDTDAKLYNTYSNIRSLIGLSASIIARGNTVLGVEGTARVYQYSYYEFDTDTSAHSQETWVSASGDSFRTRVFTLSDIGIDDVGFDPQYLILFGDENECTIAYSSRAVLFGDIGFTALADDNSQYKFSRADMYIPFYYTSSGITAHVRIIGYTDTE